MPDSNSNDPLQKARDDLIEKISIAGWREAVGENVRWIRYVYRVILVALSCVCIHYTSKVIMHWIEAGFTDEITDFASVRSIPASNVSICAQIYFNQTFIEENITVPDAILGDLSEQQGSREEFNRQLAIYFSGIMRPRKFTAKRLADFKRIVRANPHLTDFGQFVARAVIPCEQMLKRCWFDGLEFDCCSKAVRSYDDDGICYIIALNMDSDNARPSAHTLHQVRPGPSGGLTIEASAPVRDFPWLEDDAQNGFRILVGPVPFSVTSSPVLAPDLSETFIRVHPEMRIRASGCANRGQLEMPGGEFMYYDPEGTSCIVREFASLIHKYTQCWFITYLYTPNSSEICSPVVNFMLTNAFSGDLAGVFTTYGESGKFSSYETAALAGQQIENETRSALSDRARCHSHCRYWTYTSTSSFVYLDKEQLPKDTMYSKIHVYYADMAYRQHEQVDEFPSYLAFCEFGNLVGLYWGMSIVSFTHVIFYLVKYFYTWRKWSKRSVRVEDIRRMN